MNAPKPISVQQPRTVEHIVVGQATSDGAGVKLTRVITQNLQRRLDPFLMLDNFGSDNPNDYIAGFPNHPHHGFETITYMIAGRMLHEDSKGNKGLLENGGVQWMTAGRGVFHSEIPQQEEGVMEGFQLWLNLPAKDKMCTPWYRDFKNNDLPQFKTADGVAVTVIAGNSYGVEGAVSREGTQPLYLDLHLPAGSLRRPPSGATQCGGVCLPRRSEGRRPSGGRQAHGDFEERRRWRGDRSQRRCEGPADCRQATE